MKKGNYLLGIIGALIGGLVATIPWILVYVYGNMMFSALAIIIAFVALKGYKLFKGSDTKYLPIIITIVSIISVSVATLVIIPLVMLYKEGYNVSMYNFKRLYRTDSFVSGITRDFIIAIFFTFLGISGIINNLKLEVKKLDEEENNKKISK